MFARGNPGDRDGRNGMDGKKQEAAPKEGAIADNLFGDPGKDNQGHKPNQKIAQMKGPERKMSLQKNIEEEGKIPNRLDIDNTFLDRGLKIVPDGVEVDQGIN